MPDCTYYVSSCHYPKDYPRRPVKWDPAKPDWEIEVRCEQGDQKAVIFQASGIHHADREEKGLHTWPMDLLRIPAFTALLEHYLGEMVNAWFVKKFIDYPGKSMSRIHSNELDRILPIIRPQQGELKL